MAEEGSPSRHALLVTGRPGSGKTTALCRVAAALGGWRIAGFYTVEIRAGQGRTGFRAVTFDGIERVMAHVDFAGPHRIGKYGVDLSVIDELADSVLSLNPSIDLYLVDEIGKMECRSRKFVSAMRTLLASRRIMVAAIAQKGDGLIDNAKHATGAEVWELTRANRDELPGRIVAWLQSARAAQ
jgi:nucleoside-triphosphatase